MSDRAAVILLACSVIVVVAALTGAGAGYLARRDGSTYPAAVNRAAIAFTATITLAAVITTALVEVVK